MKRVMMVAMTVAASLGLRATVLEVNVPGGQTQIGFTPEQLATIAGLTSEDEIRKTGEGTFRIESIEGIGYFTGTLRISNGVYQLGGIQNGGDDYWNGHTGLGVSGTTQVIVDGTGTLFTDDYKGVDKTHYYAKTKICLSGNGYNGQGAFVVGGKTGDVNNNFYLTAWQVSLAGDATIAKGTAAGGCSQGACTWDLNGFTLTLKNGFDFKTNASAGNERDRIVSSGRIVVDGSTTYTLTPILVDPEVDGSFACTGGAKVTLTATDETGTIYGWTNAIPSGTSLSLSKEAIWKGPYLLSGGSIVTLSAGANEQLHIFNPICGDASVVSSGNSSSLIYLHGKNTYTGTTTLNSGKLVFMSKDAAPGWDGGKISVNDVKKYDRIFVFAHRTADNPNGWTGAEVWSLIMAFHANQWSLGVYAEPGDDFEVSADFQTHSSFSDMNVTALGGGRLVFLGDYPDGFTPFNLESSAENVVYSAADPDARTTNLTKSYWNGEVDVTLENMGYCFLGSYNYLYLNGVGDHPERVSRLTVGGNTCIDVSTDSLSGRPFYICGSTKGTGAVLTLNDGATTSNGVWVAVNSDVSDQRGSYIQRGGEMRADKGGAIVRVGGCPNGMACAEIAGGMLSTTVNAYLGPIYNTCVSPTAGVSFRQTGGTVDFNCILSLTLAGRTELRLTGGDFTLAGAVRIPTCDNDAGASWGDASLSAENGVTPTFKGGIVLGDRIDSTGVVAVASGALIGTPIVKKASLTNRGSVPTGDNLAVVSFDGGGLRATADGRELLGNGVEAVDHAIVCAGGAWLAADKDVTATVSVPLAKPTGKQIVSVALPSGEPIPCTVSGVVKIHGDGFGAVASAEFDSTKCQEKVTGVSVVAGGSGYSTATADLFIGGGAADIPLTVTLADADATGGLVKKGEGTIILNAVNTYGGETVVEQGVLRANAAGAIPSGSTVRIKEGGLLELSAGVDYPETIVADFAFDKDAKYPLVKCLDGRAEAPVVTGLPANWHVVRRGGVWVAKAQTGMALIVW